MPVHPEGHSGRASRVIAAASTAGLVCSLHGCAFVFDADSLVTGSRNANRSDATASPDGAFVEPVFDASLDAASNDGAPPRFCERMKGIACFDFDDGVRADDFDTALKDGTLVVDDRDAYSPPRSLLATSAASDGEATVTLRTPTLVGRTTLSFRVKPYNTAALTMLVADLHPENNPTSREGIGIFLSQGKIVLRLKDAYIETGTALPEGTWSEVRVSFSTKTGDGLTASLDGKAIHSRPDAAIPPGAYGLRLGAWGATVAIRYDDILLQSP